MTTTINATFRTSGTLTAFAAFISIELRRTLRNRRYVMFAIAFPVVFDLLYTGVLSGAAADADPGGLRGMVSARRPLRRFGDGWLDANVMSRFDQ